jgi:segregation and condensation protein A
MTSVPVKLDAFEGPLDLLLHLIARAKVDIADIFVSEVTQQFIETVNSMQQMDMELTSDFITMAATLLRIKSRSLLPQSGSLADEDEEKRDLCVRLEDYRRIRAVIEDLAEMERSAGAYFYKLGEEFAFARDPLDLSGVDTKTLYDAMRALLDKKFGGQDEPERINVVRREPVSVRARIGHILKTLARTGRATFSSLFDADHTKQEVIATFLALLEIISNGQAKADQADRFGEIEIVLIVEDGVGRAVERG